MLTLYRAVTAGTLAVATLFSAAHAYAEGGLDLIPSDAAIVVRLKSPEATIAKVGNFANQIQPGLGFFVQGQAPALGVAISNPTLGGVDLKNDWYVAAFPKKDGEPDVVFVVPATDADAMQEAVGPGFTYAVKGSWVAYSMNPAATKKAQAVIDGDSKALDLGRRAGNVFKANDISIFVNISDLTASYKDELDQAEAELERGIAQIEDGQQGLPPGMNAKAIQDVVRTLGKSVLQAVRDADAAAAGIAFSDEALTIEELLLVKSGSDSSKFLASNPANDMRLLGKLPQNELGYVAINMNMGALTKWGLSMAAAVFDGNEDVKKQLEGVSAQLADVEFGTIATGFGLNADGDSGILKSISVTEAKPASKIRELMREMSKLGGLSAPGVKQEITVEENAETYGDLKADLVKVKQEFSPEADPLGVSQQMMDLFYGKEGATTRVVTTDGMIIQTAGGGQATMKEALAALKGESKAGALKEGRRLALPKSNMVAMIDLPNFLVKGAAAIAKTGMLPIPLPAEQIAEIKIPASYLVISVGTEVDGLRAKTALPVKMFKGFMEIQKFVTQMQQQQFQNNF
ncbi:MAG: hypothetical protein H8E37_08785 [Planctomycetes bacterium]|nr:hypothetical protein [Planctomycetota bacterium]